MRKFVSLCVACAVSASFLHPVLAQSNPTFSDMEHSWYRYEEAVNELRERGVIDGNPDGTFKPKETINRAEFLKILFRARSPNLPTGTGCFPDVPDDAWYTPYVCAALRRDIVAGYPDGTFKPEQPVNFAEAMKMLLLAYDRDIEDAPREPWYGTYADELDTDSVFPRHSYVPWSPLSRERAADLLLRFLEHDESRTLPNLSPGCGKAPTDVETTLMVDGTERSFLMTAPARYVSHDPWPLIIAFHGRTNSNEDVRKYMGLDKAATDYFIAYPAALQKDTGTFHWSDPGDKLSTLRDLALFDAIVKEIGDSYCIDLDRIYTVGHSLGAWMANSVACARGGIVRGSATVGGSSMIAPCTGPSAMMLLNNPDDTLSPHSGAMATRDKRIEANACGEANVSVEPDQFLCSQYEGCDGGNDVLWCPHDIDRDRRGTYYPHLWPDGTAREMVDFFDELN